MSVERTRPSVRVEAEVRFPAKPSPAIPAGNSCCSSPAPEANAISRSSEPSPSISVPSSPGRERSTVSPGAQPPAQSLCGAIATLPRSSTPIRVASPLSASAAVSIPASARVEAEQPRDDVRRRALGALDGRLPERLRDAAVADVEARQLAVVEILVDPVALTDVEEGLRDGHRPEPGADQPGGELGDRPELLGRGPVGQHRDHHPGCIVLRRGRRGEGERDPQR